MNVGRLAAVFRWSPETLLGLNASDLAFWAELAGELISPRR